MQVEESENHANFIVNAVHFVRLFVKHANTYLRSYDMIFFLLFAEERLKNIFLR